MAFRKGWLLLAGAMSARVAKGQVEPPFSPYAVQLVGACADKAFLNSLVYERQGYTLKGHPWYQARGQEEYLYYDEDCSGAGDGNARWILDSSRPATDRAEDLDNDGVCEYHARISNLDGSRPPHLGTWRMKCGDAYADEHLALLMITSTITTTTSTTTTSTTVTSTTATSTTTTTSTTSSTTGTTTTATSTSSTSSTTTRTTTTTTRMWFHLSGLCEYKGFLNNMIFQEAGRTANGAPWFKSLTANQYVYFDLDCNAGRDGGEPRWIIDSDRPIESRAMDVDGDGGCNYHARLDSLDTSRPPSEGSWHVYCGTGWQVLDVNFTSSDPSLYQEVAKHIVDVRPGGDSKPIEEPQEIATPAKAHTTTARPTTTAKGEIDKLSLAGACEDKAFLSKVIFVRMGNTASGAPWYKSETALDQNQYIYYDPACAGLNGAAGPRWVIDVDEPDVTSSADLDNDGKCDYYARTPGTSLKLPSKAVWRLLCGQQWQDVNLTVVDLTDHSKALVDAASPATSGFAAVFALALAAAMAGGCS